MSGEELNWKQVLCVAKIGRQGVETHAVRCEVATKDEGKPWAREMVRKAHTLCSSGRIGYRSPHSFQFNVPVNTETVTCKHCQEYHCVDKK